MKRRLILAPFLALFGVSCLWAQLAPNSPSPAPDAATLAKYDKNKNGILDADERAAWQADEAKARNAGTTTEAKPAEEVVEMSPFEVSADSRGYFASNTLSGTRLNSKIEDLGASITVITKQQLLDTAALDINDIFLFEANTEGTGQFTDQTVDFQGRVLDNVQASPQTSNRVRGLAAANITTDGFTSSSRIPFDAYNLDSVEISRGPNSSLSGLGDAGGTVNLNKTRANLTRETTQLVLRGDDWGGYRTNVTLNRPLLKNRLAVNVSAVYDSKGFRRKPSEDLQRRLYSAITFKPFSSTTINGSFESFRQFRRTPNASTPTDMVTDWLLGGKPTYDPVAGTTKLNGVVIGTGLGDFAQPRGLGRDAFFDNIPSLFIDRGRIALFMPNRLQAAGIPTTANFTNNIRLMTTWSDVAKYRNATAPSPQLPLDNLVGVSDRAIYDYENINFVATNWNRDQANTYKLQLEQKLFSTPLQQAYAQVAWRLEDSNSYNHNQLTETTNLYIDVNERLLDGTPNPFFLRPYVNEIQRSVPSNRIYNDAVRGQFSYALDLRNRESRWLSMLGRHQALGYYEQVRKTTTNRTYREVVTSDATWINSANRYNSAHATITDRFYVGDNQGANVDYAPPLSNLASGTYTYRYASNVAGTNVTWAEVPLNIDGRAYGGARKTREETDTSGAALQSYFWKDRFVTTLGWRRDKQRFRNTAGNAIDPATGFGTDTNLNTWQAWTYRQGRTATFQGVLRPFKDARFATQRQSQGGVAGFLFGDLVDGFQFHYGYADSFKPASPAVNVYGEDLGNPHGVGRDYGFSVRTADNRFVARVNWYRTNQYATQVAGQFAQPVTITRGFEVGATANALETFARSVISARSAFANATEAQIQAAIYDFVKLPPGFYDKIRAGAGTVTDVNDQLSKGVEIELNYNASRSLSFKFTAAQTQAIDLTLIEATQRFIQERLPVWQTIKDDAGNLWWSQPTQFTTTPPVNQYNNQVVPNLARMRANLGQPRTQVKEWTWNAIMSYRFVSGKLNGLTVGSTIRWADKSSIGFYGIRGADGVYRQLDYTKPVYDPARASYDFFASYNLRLFSDKVRAKVQLNCRDAFAHRGLRATAFNPEGYPSTFRILDGRQVVLTTTFDL